MGVRERERGYECGRFFCLIFVTDVLFLVKERFDISGMSLSSATNIHAAFMRGLRLLKEARAENRVPVLFFLTDGQATSGETSSNQIINDVTSDNDGVANVYCLAFGSSADYELMKQVSRQVILILIRCSTHVCIGLSQSKDLCTFVPCILTHSSHTYTHVREKMTNFC